MLSFNRRNLIECAAGFIVLVVLAAIIFPPVHHPREPARRMACASNMRQIGTALMQYAQEYDEKFPPLESRTRDGKIVTWRNAIRSYNNDVS